jgi:hypothetical protein
VHKSIRFAEDDICNTFRDDLLAGLGMFGKETFATRHNFIDYMKKIEVSYIAVSTNYANILSSDNMDCNGQSASYVQVLFAENIALTRLGKVCFDSVRAL